uniref:FBD domain-containing protein n=1 Tax=Oryza punctata TaxID=4537 RepID=A0A0E0MDQ7_ORYPU
MPCCARCCLGVNDDLEECPYDDCDHCHSINNSKLLQAFSQAKNLALVADSQKFIFNRDLIRRPTFSKLKTLLLSDNWIVAFDLHEITCILRYSPVLENLTLQGPDYNMEIKGSYSRMERSSAISEHLKIVVVKCGVVDERVIKILKFLSTFNIETPTLLEILEVGVPITRLIEKENGNTARHLVGVGNSI